MAPLFETAAQSKPAETVEAHSARTTREVAKERFMAAGFFDFTRVEKITGSFGCSGVLR